jgi:hypothetical protein
MTTLVTVTCSAHAPAMLMQAHSIDKFITGQCTHLVIVEDNTYSLEKWKEMLSPFYTNHTLKLFHSRNILPAMDSNIEFGWIRQQILKFAIAPYVESDNYIILDSKNFFIKKTDVELWNLGEGCSNCHCEITDVAHLKWMPWLHHVHMFTKLDIPDTFWPPETPFNVNTKTIEKIISELSLVDLFKQCEHPSEFLLYRFYSNSPIDDPSPVCVAFWSSTPLPDSHELDNIENTETINMLSVHPEFINIYKDKLSSIADFLSKCGLQGEYINLFFKIASTHSNPDIVTNHRADQFIDPLHEPFFKDYKIHLDNLEKILQKYPGIVEGNVFGLHHTSPADYPYAGYLNARRNLALFALTRKSILEIGFNAGHSAMLLLTANPLLSYTAIDIGHNPYVDECFQYLKQVFGDRINLVVGDSTQKIPEVLSVNNQFDGYIIDGGHSFDNINADLTNIIFYANPNSVILVDDTNVPNIRFMVDYHMLSGNLLHINDASGHISSDTSMFFKLIK